MSKKAHDRKAEKYTAQQRAVVEGALTAADAAALRLHGFAIKARPSWAGASVWDVVVTHPALADGGFLATSRELRHAGSGAPIGEWTLSRDGCRVVYGRSVPVGDPRRSVCAEALVELFVRTNNGGE